MLGQQTLIHLELIHPDLKRLFLSMAEYQNFTITESIRSKARQDQLFALGKTQVKWPESKHNVINPGDLSRACDVYPLPISPSIDDPKYTHQMYFFGGMVTMLARTKGIKVRWGGDWNGNLDIKDQNFNDICHWEIVE